VPTETHNPRLGFLDWATAEVERLEDLAHHALDRQERFGYQNRIAGIVATASAYGRWLAERAELPPEPGEARA